MNNPFLKRLIKDQKEDIVHSSVFAKSQHEGIGAASVEGFSTRKNIDNNRTVIEKYNNSKIVNEFGNRTPKASAYSPSNTTSGTRSNQPESSFKTNVEKSPHHTSREFAPNLPTGLAQATPQKTPLHPPARRNPGISR